MTDIILCILKVKGKNGDQRREGTLPGGQRDAGLGLQGAAGRGAGSGPRVGGSGRGGQGGAWRERERLRSLPPWPAGGAGCASEELLFHRLFFSYNRFIRPAENVSDPVTVHFEVAITQLANVVSAKHQPTAGPTTQEPGSPRCPWCPRCSTSAPGQPEMVHPGTHAHRSLGIALRACQIRVEAG